MTKTRISYFVSWPTIGACLLLEMTLYSVCLGASIYSEEFVVQRGGNYASAIIRRDSRIITDPVTTEAIHRMSRKLLRAADFEMKTRVFIIASPDLNACVAPNGDIFVFCGMLDALETRDELAFVLGHELGHLVAQDSLKCMRVARKGEKNVRVLMTVIGSVAGGLGAATGQAASAGTSLGASLTRRMVHDATASLVQTLGSECAIAMYVSMFEGYSQEAELRADRNGARYARLAGFDPHAALNVFAKLKALESKTKSDETPIVSNFANYRPGLDARTRQMTKALEELDTATTDASK